MVFSNFSQAVELLCFEVVEKAKAFPKQDIELLFAFLYKFLYFTWILSADKGQLGFIKMNELVGFILDDFENLLIRLFVDERYINPLLVSDNVCKREIH